MLDYAQRRNRFDCILQQTLAPLVSNLPREPLVLTRASEEWCLHAAARRTSSCVLSMTDFSLPAAIPIQHETIRYLTA